MSSIKGSMRETPLPDVIQIVCSGLKTGFFAITQGASKAKIFIRDGRIVHAVTNRAQGLEAVYEVATWFGGKYVFEDCDTLEDGVPNTIAKANPMILMELGRRIDEWRIISQVIPAVSLFPYPTALPGEIPADLNPREQTLMEYVNGYYNVDELALMMNKPIINVAKELYGLITNGHVEMKGVRAPVEPPIAGRVALPRMPSDPMPANALAQTSAEDFLDVFPGHGSPVPQAPVVPAVPAPSGGPSGDGVGNYLSFIGDIRSKAKALLPEEFHAAVDSIYAKHSKILMIDGADISVVKKMAVMVSKFAVEMNCDPDTINALNTELKALFGKH